MKTYLLHNSYSPLEYILEGLDRNHCDHILLEIKKRHNLQWILATLQLERYFLNCFFSQETIDALAKIEEADRVILIDDKHQQILKALIAAMPKGVERNLFYWTPISQMYKKYSLSVARRRVMSKAKLFKIYGFDEGDRRFYDELIPHSSFYRYVKEEERMSVEEFESDFFFIGYDKGRTEMLQQLSKQIEKQGMSFNCIVLQRREPGYSYRETLEMMQKSKCVVDVTLNQRGISLRPLEALYFHRKLLTNNVYVKEEPLYHPDNVFILGEDNIDSLKTFLNKPLHDMPSSVFDYYDINNWVRRF